MASFKKTIDSAREKVAKAEARAFIARMEAIVSILEGADGHPEGLANERTKTGRGR